ncbi:PmoA family protein [Actinoplanes sp. NBRC 101535]|uniref:DUF6807 domain-containing protein n=1 Tax=Actinoplanes sp. NBRC 101535 TaxID=3032196 RepID=UPI0024A3EA77|nr:PmoA family protein [Actinoplanes sp. NBRC 101535]GLY04546.1 oxidoreductase [Actinoplanes sp. NBRC 101535]
MTGLRVNGTAVATVVDDPDLDTRLAPRPYLHPVRTLSGTVVTGELPEDHPWHLGVSVTCQDVDGVNLWGGRTYVRGEGYVWRDDHGRIVADERTELPDGYTQRLSWQDGAGRVVLREERSVRARAAASGWELSLGYALSAPTVKEVHLGSPATNGRTGGAGYGGFFWRATGGEAVAFTSTGDEPHGSDADWLAVTVGDAYTLVFRGLAGRDRWFVRLEEYVGVCQALAWEQPLRIVPGTPLTRDIRVLVADGVLSREAIAAHVAEAAI